ncbi:MAG: hypothetical protein KBT05_04390 [Bacteroidales bacterium]|nr:hypothetical protein [Candidatus Cryptobacteroides caccocaballi]
MDRSAVPLMFGINFQVNAAIVLMLENIKTLKTLRLEGEEDIEMQLEGNNYILAQAKAVVKSSTDFGNVRKSFSKALLSLSEAAEHVSGEKSLIVITNSLNPLKDDELKLIIAGRQTRRKYTELPESSKKIIADILSNNKDIKTPLNLEDLSIHVLPFETDNDYEKYKIVLDVISDFLGMFDIRFEGLRTKLHDIWSNSVFDSGTKVNRKIKLTKQDIVWPLIVSVIDKKYLSEESVFCTGLDEADYQDVCAKYSSIIDSKCERFDFVTRVITDYENKRSRSMNSIQSFVNNNWEVYRDDFESQSLDDNIVESLIKVTLSNILLSRRNIDSIKSKVKL